MSDHNKQADKPKKTVATLTRLVAAIGALVGFVILTAAIAFVMHRGGDIWAVTWREHFNEAELAATGIFAVVGAAAGRSLLPAGTFSWGGLVMIFLASFMTANGGGTIRDILSNAYPFWISSPEYVLIPGISALILASVHFRTETNARRMFELADDFCTGLFCCLGTFKAAALVGPDSPAFFLLAILIGTMTAVGGGFLRDVLVLRRRPRALTTTTGICAMFGAFAHATFLAVAAQTDVGLQNFPEWIVVSLIVMLAIEFTRTYKFFEPNVPDLPSPVFLKPWKKPKLAQVDGKFDSDAA